LVVAIRENEGKPRIRGEDLFAEMGNLSMDQPIKWLEVPIQL
jgi:hypothetical protein